MSKTYISIQKISTEQARLLIQFLIPLVSDEELLPILKGLGIKYKVTEE